MCSESRTTHMEHDECVRLQSAKSNRLCLIGFVQTPLVEDRNGLVISPPGEQKEPIADEGKAGGCRERAA